MKSIAEYVINDLNKIEQQWDKYFIAKVELEKHLTRSINVYKVKNKHEGKVENIENIKDELKKYLAEEVVKNSKNKGSYF